MAFDSLSEKLQTVFKKLRSKGALTEKDVQEAMKEVKRALLEADVNFKVVKQFINTVSERAIGQDVLNGLNPGQMVIKIVKEEMVNLMGSETTEIKMLPSNEITVVMMCGLQGAGKTTTAAKLAGQFKNKGKKPLLAALDVYRPAAIKQLEINGEKVGVPVFTMGDNHKPVDIAKAAIEHASKNHQNLVFLDTAGRLHVDEAMMEELEVIEILSTAYDGDEFPGYENIRLSFSQLETIIRNKRSGWLDALRNQKAVYLITDTSNGKMYVGSATAQYGMLLQRWTNYIDNGHGGNVELKHIVDTKGFDYIKANFQYSVLENYNARMDDNYILSREKWWKDTLCTRQFGYNKN